MKRCKKCNIEFEPQRGLLNYCSLACRNSRNWTVADKLKKSISAKNSAKVIESNSKLSDKLKEYWSDETKRLAQSYRIKNIWTDEMRKIYSSNRMGVKHSAETIEKIRTIQKQRLKDNPMLHPNRLCAGINESYPERMIREYFENIGYVNGIDFIQQFEYKGYYVDFYIPKTNICIEVDGEYWHDSSNQKEIDRENEIKKTYKLYRLSAKQVLKKEYEDLLKNIFSELN